MQNWYGGIPYINWSVSKSQTNPWSFHASSLIPAYSLNGCFSYCKKCDHAHMCAHGSQIRDYKRSGKAGSATMKGREDLQGPATRLTAMWSHTVARVCVSLCHDEEDHEDLDSTIRERRVCVHQAYRLQQPAAVDLHKIWAQVPTHGYQRSVSVNTLGNNCLLTFHFCILAN